MDSALSQGTWRGAVDQNQLCVRLSVVLYEPFAPPCASLFGIY